MITKLDHLPNGWRPMAQKLLDEATRQFPGIVITDISAKRGWLSIDFDKHSVSVQDYWRATKMCEGISSISWNVCVECGSHHAAQRPGHILPICEGCIF